MEELVPKHITTEDILELYKLFIKLTIWIRKCRRYRPFRKQKNKMCRRTITKSI